MGIWDSMKPIGFRPTPKVLEKIKATMEKKKINRNQAINLLLETSQLEQPKTEKKGDYFELPPNLFCEKDHRFWLKETLLEECEDCKRKSECTAWRK